MERLDEIAKQLKEFRRENAKQFGELRNEIAELKQKQSEILSKLGSGEPPRREDKKKVVEEKREAERSLEMYCADCFELRPIIEPKRIELPDGSIATQGRCSVCGTTVFRMATMTGVLTSDTDTNSGRHRR
jgi:DNA repair exonuclease SbcCD ATPase subunit